MQFPTRELTRPEMDVLLAISETVFAKWNPIRKEAEKASDLAEKEAERITAEVKATPEYQEVHGFVHGPQAELSGYIEACGGYSTFRKKWGDVEAPIEAAHAAARPIHDRAEQLKVDADDDAERLVALTFLRLGYQAGARDALNVATNPGSPADTLKFMRDLMDDSPATDALITATVDKILASPAMAVVIGGER